MLPNERVPDKDILRLVMQRLARTGLASQTPVTATVHHGNVTLLGTINFEHQRKAAVKAVQGIHGVQHVLDQLRVQPATLKWHATHGGTHPAGSHPLPPPAHESHEGAEAAGEHSSEPPAPHEAHT